MFISFLISLTCFVSQKGTKMLSTTKDLDGNRQNDAAFSTNNGTISFLKAKAGI
jgi:hypothetical protein